MKSNTSAYLKKFHELNIVLADPETTTKWNTLINYFIKNEVVFLTEHSDDSVAYQYAKDIFMTINYKETPGKLPKLGKDITNLIETINKPITKNSHISKLSKLYLKTAIISNDNNSIKIGNNLAEKLLEKIRKN